MTREELLNSLHLKLLKIADEITEDEIIAFVELKNIAPCEDCISRQALLKLMGEEPFNWTDSDKELQEVEDYRNFRNIVEQLPPVNPQESKTGYCKDCKWWKDSDGAFRRGIWAESICRINTDIVYQGEGYCYLFEPKESEG